MYTEIHADRKVDVESAQVRRAADAREGDLTHIWLIRPRYLKHT